MKSASYWSGVLIVVVVVGNVMAACKSNSGGGGDGAKPSPTGTPLGAGTGGPVAPLQGSKIPINITAQGSGQQGDLFEVGKADTVSIQFSISGPASPAAVAIGLSQNPGGQLSNPQSFQPTFSWPAATATQQESALTLVVRDLAACQRVMGAAGASQCALISTSSQANPQYDEARTFRIRIRDFVPGATGGAGGLGGLLGGGGANGNILQTIIGTLQGGGSISSILPMLQQIAPGLAGQAGAGGLNIQQLLGILRGGGAGGLGGLGGLGGASVGGANAGGRP